MDEYRTWLTSQIESLSSIPSEEWTEIDHQESREIVSEAYERAIALHLSQAEILISKKPIRIRLCEMLQSLPAPSYLNIKQLAELLKVSVRTIQRRIYQGSIPEPMKVGRLSRWSVKDLKDYGINL